MSTGPVTSTSANILLICPFPELHYDSLLEKNGFKVVSAKSLDHGISLWRPFAYKLVLIVVDGNMDAALEFCEGVKKSDPTQSVAFVTGWHAYVPPQSCPDEVIRQEYNPATFVKKVTELSQTD